MHVLSKEKSLIVVLGMHRSATLLGERLDPGLNTQRVQESVLAQLAQLFLQAHQLPVLHRLDQLDVQAQLAATTPAGCRAASIATTMPA